MACGNTLLRYGPVRWKGLRFCATLLISFPFLRSNFLPIRKGVALSERDFWSKGSCPIVIDQLDLASARRNGSTSWDEGGTGLGARLLRNY